MTINLSYMAIMSKDLAIHLGILVINPWGTAITRKYRFFRTKNVAYIFYQRDQSNFIIIE